MGFYELNGGRNSVKRPKPILGKVRATNVRVSHFPPIGDKLNPPIFLAS